MSDLARESDPQDLLTRFFSRPADAELLRNHEAPMPASSEIPRTIHQIWLGSALPARLERFRETWRRHNPGWEFKLWTDAEVAEAGFDCADLVASTDCFGQKSDVLRAEIISRHGGFYVDLDYECYRPLEPVRRAEFAACLRWIPQANLSWPKLFGQPLIVCNSFFGARKGHPLLAEYIKRVRATWTDRALLDFSEAELDPISVRVLGGIKRAAHLKETSLRTYLPFHRLVWENAEEADLFPPALFNPVISGWPAIYAMPGFWKQWKTASVFPRFGKYSKVRPDSVGRHWSGASWL